MTDFADKIKILEEEVGKVIVGQENLKRDIIVALLAGGHILLEELPVLQRREQ